VYYLTAYDGMPFGTYGFSQVAGGLSVDFFVSVAFGVVVGMIAHMIPLPFIQHKASRIGWLVGSLTLAAVYLSDYYQTEGSDNSKSAAYAYWGSSQGQSQYAATQAVGGLAVVSAILAYVDLTYGLKPIVSYLRSSFRSSVCS
jgi:hypothetical protein